MADGNRRTAIIAELERVATAAPPGTRLPSVRELMARHHAGPGTVQAAIAALAARGVVTAQPGRGTFVARRDGASTGRRADLSWQTVALGPGRALDVGALEDLLRPAASGEHVLSTGYLPPDLQPHGALAQAVTRAARRAESWDRMPLGGVASLRRWFAADIGGDAHPDDVLVCSGGQAALTTCLRGLASPGAPVIVESPTYHGVLVLARAAGLTPVPVPADHDGILPEHLADALARTGARVVYLQPTFANPHGATLAASRRSAVLDAVAAAGAFVVEDDAFRWLGAEPRSPAPPPLVHDDRDGHVVHVRSLTKPTSPGLRVAGILARGSAAVRLRATRIVDDYVVAGPLQEAAVELVSSPAWRTHLRRLRSELQARRDALAAAVARELGPGRIAALPRGGMHLWVTLDPHEDEVALAARAARAGVIVSPGRPFFPAEPTGPFLRLTYAGATPARLAEGVARLAEVRADDAARPL